MHDGELWQVFAENGEAVAGKGATDEMFTHDDSLVMGNSHVWLWRKTNDDVEILLQKRSMTRSRSPGKYHISAAGHINMGESAVVAAERETKEELGLSIDTDRLYLVHVTRIARHKRSLLYVFTYQVDTNQTFIFDDGEVESVMWVSIDEFKAMTHRADNHNLIDQGRQYFDPLIDAIKQQST